MKCFWGTNVRKLFCTSLRKHSVKFGDSICLPSDLLTNEKPDERQIMTYVSCYYHAFQGAMQVTCCNLSGCDIILCDLS